MVVQAPPSGSSHTPRTPPPPQVSGGTQRPQSIVFPQPSPVTPHWRCSSAQVSGVQFDAGGETHDARSKIMYSRMRSCGVSRLGGVPHSFGNATL
jgi:hypothetical protein